MEYYICFSRSAHDEFIAMADSSIRNNLMVWENSSSEDLRRAALWNVICAYKYSGRSEEAKKYAQLYPETDPGQSDPMEICLEGEELLAHLQTKFAEVLDLLCGQLGKMWTFGDPADPHVRTCVNVEKAIIETVITDGNFLRFSTYLEGIHEKLANIALSDGDHDTAVRELETAMQYAKDAYTARTSGKQFYTCPILNHCDYDYTDSRQFTPDEVYLKERLQENPRYDPLRSRGDFKALLL